MKIGRTTAFAAVIVIMLGGVIISSSLGLFDTESSKSAATIKAGEFEGKADPNDIRGSFSFADISKQFGVEVSVLAEAFGISDENGQASAFQIKGLEEKYAGLPNEIGTSSVRLFVGFMTGLPVELGAYIPLQAAEIIRGSASGLTEDRLTYLDSHTVDLASLPQSTITNDLNEEEREEEASYGNETPSESNATAIKPASYPPIKEAEQKAYVEASPASIVQETTAVADSTAGSISGEAEAASIVVEAESATAASQEAQDAAPKAAGDQQATPDEHDSKKEERSVKGNTTIFDLMSWGVSRDLIGPAIGIELPGDNGAKLRDLIIAAGKSFEDAKIILQKMVDESN